MTKYLPKDNYQWGTQATIDSWTHMIEQTQSFKDFTFKETFRKYFQGYFVEVDFVYDQALHDLHKTFPILTKK